MRPVRTDGGRRPDLTLAHPCHYGDPMADDTFWTVPPDRMVHGSIGHRNLTGLLPPFDVDARALPANAPVRAAQFASSFATVDEVVEEIGPRSVLDVPCPETRADQDVVQAAAWSHVLGMSDPAPADDGNDLALLSEARGLRERYPDARIVGHAAGRPGHEPFEVTGDPHAVASALGIATGTLTDLRLDEEDPADVEWADFAALALGESDPWGRERIS